MDKIISIITFSSIAGVLESQLFSTEDLTFFETKRHLTMVKKSNTSCTQVHVELIDRSTLRTKFDGVETWLKFKRTVRWPATMSIDADGTSEVVFKKRRHIHWENDTIRAVNSTEEPLASIYPNYFVLEVVFNRKLTDDTCLLALKHVYNGYHFFGPGQHFTVRLKMKGKKKKKQYSPVPLLPIETLDAPNPGPGKWWSADRRLYIIVKTYPNGTLSKWLYNLESGMPIFATEPQGTFCPYSELRGKRQIYLLAAGTGITPLLSVILWILQTTKYSRVHLVFYNRYEEDIIWRKELDESSRVDGRFTIEYILTKPDDTWQGRTGRVSLEQLSDMFPVYNSSRETQFYYFGICGQYNFSMQTAKWLKEDMKYPEDSVYTFLGQ